MARKSPESGPITVRPAARQDADRIAQLSTQLGYPSSREEVERRLDRIEGDQDYAVFVAVSGNGRVLGWVHVCVSHLVESDPEAELGGLVVDEAQRRGGTGRFLMQRAERWAREKGLRSVYLRSNILRKDAHAFYEELGYRVVKTQYAFRKIL